MWSTVPDGAVDCASATGVTLVKPRVFSCCSACDAWVPVRLGRAMFAGPVETLTVTVLFLATLLPLSGLVLITRPAFTDELGSLFLTGFSPAALICVAAWA